MYLVQKDMSSRPKDFLPRLAYMVTLDPWIEWLAIRKCVHIHQYLRYVYSVRSFIK